MNFERNKTTTERIGSAKIMVNSTINSKSFNKEIMEGTAMPVQNSLVKLSEVLVEFKNIEKHYRKIYNSALDIENFEVAQKSQSDAYLKIRKLKEWINIVIELSNNVINSNILNDELLNESETYNGIPNKIKINDQVFDKAEIIVDVTQESSVYESKEKNKVGEYVRSKMYELSNSGFIFSDDDIYVMQQLSWAKENLGINYEFIKITYMKDSPTEKIKKEFEYNFCWNESFKFGKYEILVTNQLFERDRNKFDIWYDKLDKVNILRNKNRGYYISK